MIKILIVEDDLTMSRALGELLMQEGFDCDRALTQKEAQEKIAENIYDLVLIDLMLPDGNGFAVFSAVKAKSDAPVIFLTASTDEYSTVTGLDMGADDYIEKPYRPRELISRIRSVLRRTGKAQSIVNLAGLVIDTEKAHVTKNGQEVFLSALEYKILLVFAANTGKVLSRNKILCEIWDVAGDFVNDNTLTVYIKRLRDKIEDDPQDPKIIRTVRGIGYKAGEDR